MMVSPDERFNTCLGNHFVTTRSVDKLHIPWESVPLCMTASPEEKAEHFADVNSLLPVKFS